MSYISPRISIVDGTHLLCLLPSSNNVLNSSDSGSSSEEKQHQQTHVTNDDVHHTNNEEGQTINIPAVPLSSICNIYSGEYISCVSGDDIATGDININSKPQVSNSSDNNNLHELPIETMQIHTSDISNAQYRFIHSTSLINDVSTPNNVPLRVVVCDDLDEGIVSVNNNHVKVTLSSFTTSDEMSAQHGDEDDCKIYGGEHYNIVNDDVGNGDDIIVNSTQSGNKSQQSFEVQGAGSCLVADFLGIVGYEQALVLPQISTEVLSKSSSTVGSKGDESIEQQKELLQMILRHSFLTDGMGILLPRSYANNTHLTTIKADDDSSSISLTMSPLERLGEEAFDGEESPNDGGSILLSQEGDASAQHSSNTTNDTQPTDTCNSTEPQEDPKWLKLIAQTVEHRLSKQVEETNQIKRSEQVRIDLVNQGRRTLHAASRPMNHSIKEGGGLNTDPEVFRLRYGVRPRTSSGGEGGISVVLDLELDILMPRICKEGTANSPSSTTNTIHDFHISCSLTSKNKKNNQATTITPENIRTSSGVVPTLQSGDYITMLASVCLEDIKISMNDDDNSTLDISIQGLWVDDNASSCSSSNHTPTRRGAVLYILRLPIDSLFLAPPMLSSQRRSGGHWIQHEIDFTSNSQHCYPEPSAIVDYRQPRTLTIDTSNEMNSTNAKMWKDLVSNLNASIGSGGSYIDLYCKKDSPRLKLVIFSSNPEERVGEWCVLLFVVKAEFIEACYLSFIPDANQQHFSYRQACSTESTRIGKAHC